MLLAIYDAAIRAVDQGVASTMAPGSAIDPAHRLAAQKLLLLLLEGIDPKLDALAENTQQLIVYCTQQVQSASVRDWMTVRKILGLLREAFEQVRDVANALEEEGVIPPLEWGLTTAELARA